MDFDWQGYLVWDSESGTLLRETQDPYDAAHVAAVHSLELGEQSFVWDAALPPLRESASIAAANPTSRMAETAFRKSLLPRLGRDDVMSIPLEQAWKTILAELPRTRMSAGREVPVEYLGDMHKGIKNLLRSNYKTSKDYRGLGRPVFVKGLSLVPDFGVFSGLAGNEALMLPYHGLEQDGYGDAKPDERLRPGERPTLCAGSSEQCRATCLVFSGSNVKDIYLTQVKQALTAALIRHPREFVRLLHASIDKFVNGGRDDGRQRYIRLNVYSDVMWELVAPWIFKDFPGEPYGSKREHLYYDYSKVSGRETPANYDLTFSFSGDNGPLIKREFDRGSRVAVVFFFPEEKRLRMVSTVSKEDRDKIRARFYKDATWLGRRVIDGDIDDVRPRDPGGVWVGLTWKPVKGYAGIRPTTFVLYAYRIKGQFVVPVTPRHMPFLNQAEEAGFREISALAVLREQGHRTGDKIRARYPLPVLSDQRELPGGTQ